jgi:uncharacterized protein (DUF934 family)
MPTLIKDGAVASDHWSTGDRPLLAPDAWREQPDAGLLLQVDAEPEAVFATAPLIAIEFPEFKDGRGLSLGALLRRRFGFKGDLRAVGDVHHDLAHYLIRCGFSSFVLPDGRDVAVALKGTTVYSHYYQGSVRDPEPLYRKTKR